MYKTFRFTEVESHNMFYVSDLHIGHDPKWPEPLWVKRGFASVIDHDNGLINRWNDVCDESSIVWNLGDCTFSDPDGNRFMSLMRRLRFKKHYLLIGNHTSGARQAYVKTLAARFPDAVTNDGKINYEVYPLEMPVDGNPDKVVVFMPTYVEIVVKSTRMTLCHYPVASWNHMADNAMQIGGHEHSADPRRAPSATDFGKTIDISVENLLAYGQCPISHANLKALMDKKSYKPIGHH